MRVTVREAIVVEGKHDAIRLRSVVDATIVETDGFRLFRRPETMELLRRLAKAQGLIILTDSDSAGFLIRDCISGAVPSEYIKQAYAPEIFGKERRKATPSKEGLLGVEGIDGERLLQVLRQAGATIVEETSVKRTAFLDKTRLFEDGLSGGAHSAVLRERLLSALDLPRKLSANRLIDVVNTLLTEEEYLQLLERIKGEDTE